ncbi:MAG: DUF1330 domain-containing protein [Chitinophagaceae bacterium]|nr:DUF1330 domain-containing protein [Chitinophagaceae bacterium]
MPAYIIVEVTVHDSAAYEAYKRLTPASIAAFEGKFIVRGGPATTLEGSWQPERIVVLQFPSRDLAHQWWESSEYAPAKAIRQASATTKMILIEGPEML